METLHIIFLAIILYSLYLTFMKKEKMEGKLDTYVAERVATYLKQNPTVSFPTFQAVMRDNNNQHKALDLESTFNTLKALGASITAKDVIPFL